MIMEEEALKYADKLLDNLPENAFEDRIFEREKPSEENPNPTWPAWEHDLLLKLVGDGLLSKSMMEDQYDSQQKYAYSITPKGAELVSKGTTYEEFLQNKIDDENRKKERQEKEDIIQNLTIKQLKWTIWQVKHWWVFILINIVITLLTIYVTSLFDTP